MSDVDQLLQTIENLRGERDRLLAKLAEVEPRSKISPGERGIYLRPLSYVALEDNPLGTHAIKDARGRILARFESWLPRDDAIAIANYWIREPVVDTTEVLRSALIKISAWGEGIGEVTSSFREPNSAKLAREAVAAEERLRRQHHSANCPGCDLCFTSTHKPSEHETRRPTTEGDHAPDGRSIKPGR